MAGFASNQRENQKRKLKLFAPKKCVDIFGKRVILLRVCEKFARSHYGDVNGKFYIFARL